MKIKRITQIFLCLALLVVMGGEFILSAFSITASAETRNYSDVFEDLTKDKEFDVSDYPLYTYDEFVAVNSDSDPDNDVEYLSLFHIAESENKELFIYTYQPLNNISDITASTILMSIGEDSVDYDKYKLKCVSSNGAFKKYKLYNPDGSEFVVPNVQERYYNFVEIERPFDALLDEKISNETITNYKAHTIGQTWCCYYTASKLVYEAVSLDVVEITPTLTDFVYLPYGITWGDIVGLHSAGHAHYIAFNIDNYDADYIVDADIIYKSAPYKSDTFVTYTLGIESDRRTSTEYKTLSGEWVSSLGEDDWKRTKFTITDDQKIKYEGRGLFAREYKWDRIMKASNFVDNMEAQGISFTDSTKNTLNNSQFVFAFEETEFKSSYLANYSENPHLILSEKFTSEGTKVAEVDIIRIKFMVGEKTYNLGVVGDTTTGDDIPGGVGSGLDLDLNFDDLEESIEALFALICLVGLLVLFSLIIKPLGAFFKVLWKGIKSICGMLWAIVTLPFQILAQLFDNIRR